MGEVRLCWSFHGFNTPRYVDPCASLSTPTSSRSALPGVVIALFIQCMTALLSPTNRAKGGSTWGLVGSTVALISVATASFVMGLWFQPIAYINNREFPGGDLEAPGPMGYMWLRKWTTMATISNAAYQVNQWLVDGLLVSPMQDSATQVLNLSCFYSCLVATSFTT